MYYIYIIAYYRNMCITYICLFMCNFYFRLCPYLYDLTHMNPENTRTCIQEIIKEKHNKFEKNKTRYPDMDTVRLYIQNIFNQLCFFINKC